MSNTLENSGDGLKTYLQQISQFPLLTPKEEVELLQLAQNGDKDATSKLVTSNLRLVIKIAKFYVGLGIPFADLIQEGTIGLYDAIEKFDINLGYKFATYAVYWIKQRITKAITNDSQSIRIPSNVRNELMLLNKNKKEFIEQNGREPTFDEMLKMTTMSKEKLLDVLELQSEMASLDKAMTEDSKETTLLDFIPSNSFDTPQTANNQTVKREAILKVLDSLPDREKDILIKRFGLDNGIPKSLEQVGELVGLTRERVRQLELNALNKLRNPARASALMEYQ